MKFFKNIRRKREIFQKKMFFLEKKNKIQNVFGIISIDLKQSISTCVELISLSFPTDIQFTYTSQSISGNIVFLEKKLLRI